MSCVFGLRMQMGVAVMSETGSIHLDPAEDNQQTTTDIMMLLIFLTIILSPTFGGYALWEKSIDSHLLFSVLET